METRNETIDLTPFVLGATYTRFEIAEHGKVPVPDKIFTTKWAQGIVELKNAVFLFVTLSKDQIATPAHAYLDYFDGNMFWWQSQNRQSRTTDLIARMGDGAIPIYLFARVHAKERGVSVPFVFCGRLSPPVMESDKPVDCLFDALDYVDGATGALADIYSWRPSVPLPEPATQRRSSMSRKRGGQGIQLDKDLRLAIEQYAMQHAKQHYVAAGYEVIDTSLTRPYDLVCRRGAETRRVEVKGTTTTGDRVLLTVGEVLAAREPDIVTDLYVVRSIVVTLLEGARALSGGSAHLVSDWQPLDEHLEAKQYSYAVPA